MVARKQVTVLRFDGPRFEDHGLDVDVLAELVAYKRLLQETAKEIWRRNNIQRARLPKGFEADITLKFYTLEPGSTAVPLMRELPDQQQPLLFDDELDDELDEAAVLLEEAIFAAGRSEVAPRDLPRKIIPLFEDLGKTLRDDETLFIETGGLKTFKGARYNRAVKRQILSWASASYPDAIDVVGEVRATDLDGLKFTLRLEDGRKITGHFAPEQEGKILEALGEHSSRRMRVRGMGEFAPEDGSLKQIVTVRDIELLGPELDHPFPDKVPIWARVSLIGSELFSGNEWTDVPTDLASNVDHYLYGKRAPH
jgi:hypothetical protein